MIEPGRRGNGGRCSRISLNLISSLHNILYSEGGNLQVYIFLGRGNKSPCHPPCSVSLQPLLYTMKKLLKIAHGKLQHQVISNVQYAALYIVYSSLKLSKCTVMHLYFVMSIGAKTLLRREEGLVYTPYGQCISEEGSNVYFD